MEGVNESGRDGERGSDGAREIGSVRGMVRGRKGGREVEKDVEMEGRKEGEKKKVRWGGKEGG